jgi:hypothetical protein
MLPNHTLPPTEQKQHWHTGTNPKNPQQTNPHATHKKPQGATKTTLQAIAERPAKDHFTRNREKLAQAFLSRTPVSNRNLLRMLL